MPQSLIAILDLETLDANLYRGQSPPTDRQRVFGGQVAGQALVAAGRTVEEPRHVHSLHAYFVRPGDPTWPIIYEVERVRDGRSFTTRRVVATQRGREIFLLSASFHRRETGLDHQRAMPDVPDPDALAEADVEDDISRAIARHSAIELHGVAAAAPGGGDAGQAGRQVWFRTQEELPEDPLVHVCAAAYASDLTLLTTALLPHHIATSEVQLASLDHAMWFHRPFRADDWLLYDMHSPSATGGRGLSMGHIFTRAGDLVVSVVQEGLMRVDTSDGRRGGH